MPWVAPVVGAAASIGSAALSTFGKGDSGGGDTSGQMAQQKLVPAAAALILGSQMKNQPWKELPYADMSQGWWNMPGTPPTTQLPGFTRYDKDLTYQGFEGGDYNRLEQALRTPGETQAKNTFDAQMRSLSDALGGRGAYGSSAFTQTMNNDAWSNYMNTLSANAANATAQRYNFQGQDLGRKLQADTANWQGRMSENQFANQFGLQRAAQQNQIDQLPWQWEVAKRQGLWNAMLGQQQWESNQRDSVWANIQGLTNMFDITGANSQGQNLDLQRQQASRGNSLGGPLGSIGGSLLGQWAGGLQGGDGGYNSSSGGGVNYVGNASPGINWNLGPSTGVSGSARVSANY